MSMIGTHYRVSRADLSTLRRIVREDDEDAYCDFMEEIEEEGECYSLDKSWQQVHALLAGDPWKGRGPLSRVVLGGKEIGEDQGTIFSYGPPLYLTASQVKECAGALEKLTRDELEQRLKRKPWARIKTYPGDTPLSSLGGTSVVHEDIDGLRAFFCAARDHGDSMLFVLG